MACICLESRALPKSALPLPGLHATIAPTKASKSTFKGFLTYEIVSLPEPWRPWSASCGVCVKLDLDSNEIREQVVGVDTCAGAIAASLCSTFVATGAKEEG
eukprot:scaffold85500_cov29-Tisochrysis_lutea.AAC.1